eukprot:gnl/Spiro4/9430_TR4987_c0_g1_i1.p1 gnl/Spiro4/9430_TR4987_c0_g1~~gnl/Spiro4/9430_TR4987_c0_g1_i1.p1  ORF type:complete len:352 (+),score=61.18 gnl/Spiro4/9430_TR4987_c0_g1_i1:98-1153(+)
MSQPVINTDVEQQILHLYEIVQLMGRGAYGVVWKAIDKRTREVVAVKKVFQAFRNSTDAQRTYREVMFLRSLRHDTIIRLVNLFRAQNDQDLYMVFDFMDTDLHHAIHRDILEEVHKKFIIYQTLKALKFLHSAQLLHRDLKPSNILLNAQCVVKLCDFGLARSLISFDTQKNVLTDYVATRWYRAPEILLGSTCYTKGVDMWSLGCIIGELFAGKSIFPGTSTQNQLEKILAVTGVPSPEDIASMKSDIAHSLLNVTVTQQQSLAELFPRAPVLAMDLMRRLLQFNPEKRLSAVEALRHPYLQEFHNPAEETVSDAPIQVAIDDNMKMSVTEYRNVIYQEIIRWKQNGLQ